MALNIDIVNIYNDYLPSTESVIFTVPSGQKYIIKNMIISNEEPQADRTLTVELWRNGKKARVAPYVLKPEHTFIEEDEMTLEAGDFIRGWTDAADKVTAKINGVREIL